MAKFRKRAVVIEAFQWWPGQFTDWPQWAKDELKHYDSATEMITSRDGSPKRCITATDSGDLYIKTLEGPLQAQPGDWIIQGVKGELYPCKPDIFAATYEAVE